MKTKTCLALCGLTIGLGALACEDQSKHAPPPTAPSATTPASSNEPAVDAPLELVEQHLTVQAVKGYVAFLGSTPKDWPMQDVGGAKVFRDPNPGSPSAITIIFKPFVRVMDLSAAEEQLQQLDSVGEDKIADRRQLGPGKFLLATAPRGSRKLVTVSVITSGKRTAVLAKCSSTLARQTELEKICGSVSLQEDVVPPPIGAEPPKRHRG